MIPEFVGSRYPTLHIRRYYTAGPLAFSFTSYANWGPVDALMISMNGADRNVLINGGDRLTVHDGEPMLFETRMTACTIAAGTACEIILFELYSDRWEPSP